MVYLPHIYHQNQPNVGEYTVHGYYGYGEFITLFRIWWNTSILLLLILLAFTCGGSNEDMIRRKKEKKPVASQGVPYNHVV